MVAINGLLLLRMDGMLLLEHSMHQNLVVLKIQVCIIPYMYIIIDKKLTMS